jgi:hypothetical protein
MDLQGDSMSQGILNGGPGGRHFIVFVFRGGARF